MITEVTRKTSQLRKELSTRILCTELGFQHWFGYPVVLDFILSLFLRGVVTVTKFLSFFVIVKLNQLHS